MNVIAVLEIYPRVRHNSRNEHHYQRGLGLFAVSGGSVGERFAERPA